jgi:threonine aldolase
MGSGRANVGHSPDPFGRDEKVEAAMAKCDRFLAGSQPAPVHDPEAALLIELPRLEIGDRFQPGRSWPGWPRAKKGGTAEYLDGARFWEAAPYYKRSLAEIEGLFNSVYVSFYKDLGAIAGCCVAADSFVIDELSIWRRRHGGRLFGLWPYAAAAPAVLHKRLLLMPKYYRQAVAIGRTLADVPDVEVMPAKIQGPMTHLFLPVSLAELRARAIRIAKREMVWTFVPESLPLQRIEFSVDDAPLEFTPEEVAPIIGRLAGVAA